MKELLKCIKDFCENEEIKLSELGYDDNDRYEDFYVEEYLGILANIIEAIDHNDMETLLEDLKTIIK